MRKNSIANNLAFAIGITIVVIMLGRGFKGLKNITDADTSKPGAEEKIEADGNYGRPARHSDTLVFDSVRVEPETPPPPPPAAK